MNREVGDLWQRSMVALCSAERLLPDDPDGAASRAYYSAFYAISALLATKEMEFKKHSAVERTLHKELIKTGILPVECGEAYSFLREMRSIGDYGGGKHVLPNNAEDAVNFAKRIVDEIQKKHPDIFPKG